MMPKTRSEIRREANLQCYVAIRNYLDDGNGWVGDWSVDDNYKLAERMNEIAEVLRRR